MSAKRPRTLKTVTGAGGTSETYELAIDPARSTLDTALRVAKLAEDARIDALFTADLLSFGAQGAIGAPEPLVFVSALSQVADILGGGVDLSDLPLDKKLPESLLPDVTSVNRRRGRVDIFVGYVRQGYTLRELVIAAQDTGHWAAAGTPEQLADAVEERFRAGVLDVLSLSGLADPRQHDFVVNGLLHELRGRGIVADDYTGTTLRENLGLELPARAPAPVQV